MTQETSRLLDYYAGFGYLIIDFYREYTTFLSILHVYYVFLVDKFPHLRPASVVRSRIQHSPSMVQEAQRKLHEMFAFLMQPVPPGTDRHQHVSMIWVTLLQRNDYF
eukprot:38276_1